MKNYFINKLKSVPIYAWIFLAILCLGIFLRTYQFHDWLHFGSDQSRDALVVEAAASGRASWPLLGPEASNTLFHLGPIYYYFQIIFVKIFGIGPDKLAYPDLFFSILAIPLLYFFSKRYFNTQISLVLSGIYAVSYYAVKYSRFAWNTNPIPFFVMLFLLSIVEFLSAKEKTSWWWIIALGISLGAGVQLHTLLLLLLPIIVFLAFLYLIKKNPKLWKKCSIVFLILILLNVGQIISEKETGFANSKLFMNAFTDRSSSGAGRLKNNFFLDMSAHAQANIQMLSSLGNKDNPDFESILSHPKKSDLVGYGLAFFGIILSYAFSVLGYGALFYNLWKEKNEKKKYFLMAIALYVSLSFLILLSIINGAPLRYFIFTIFVPFILLGFLMKIAMEKYPRKYLWILCGVFLFFLFTNTISIKEEAQALASKTRGDSGYVVLGEIESMVEYMRSQSFPQKEAYFTGGSAYRDVYYKSMAYVAAKLDFNLIRVGDQNAIPVGKPVFSISKSSEGNHSSLMKKGNFEGFKDFGQIGIYKLKN